MLQVGEMGIIIMKTKENKIVLLIILRQIIIYLLILCAFSMKWCTTYFGNISLNEIQIADFLDWIEKQDFYNDTVIYIAGDHSSMQGDFVTKSDYDKYNGDTDRNVYNVFINSCLEPVKEKNRKFTTLDFCPSILAALGVDIEGNRIVLGTNLFSSEQTLSEKYGYEELFEELGKKSTFYNKEIMYP